MFLVLLNGLHSKLNEAVFEDTNVEVLTSDNLDEFVEKSPAMVMFYAAWSKQSREFVDKYISIASDLDESIFFGALDCGEYEDVCHRYEIRDFPSLVVFKNEEHQLYTGARTAEDIFTDVRSGIDYDDSDDIDDLQIEETTYYVLYNIQNYNPTMNTIDNDSKRINETPKETPNSSEFLTSSCLVLFLTMIANIISY